jgi:5'(3')-deoxyribonucleotidase
MPKNASNKPIIAVDIDDVLKESASVIIEYSNRRWGMNLTIDDYTEHWGKMWKIDDDEWRLRNYEVGAEGTLVHGKPLDTAKQVLLELSATYELVITTSRQEVISKPTLAWLEEHFKDVFASVHFARIWDDSESDVNQKAQATKGTLLKQIGARYLIDDQTKHCVAAAEKGIAALLFGDYPWNRHDVLPDGVTRVKDWKAVEEYFRGRAD